MSTSPVDLNAAVEPRATAVLLHPHPDYGGNRFHPVIEALYRALPEVGVTALRLDFESSDVGKAAAQVRAALDLAPTLPVMLIGYSYGAGIAASIDDPRVAGWFLVAPPLAMIDADGAPAGIDDRSTGVAVPEFDQFSPPDAVGPALKDWRRTTVATVPGADHFLAGRANDIVAVVVDWLPSALAPGSFGE